MRLEVDYDKVNSLGVGDIERIHDIYKVDFIANNGRVTVVQIGGDNEGTDTERTDN